MKLAVFFPGIGYTNDKPLLYYTKRLLKNAGYETIDVVYSNFDNSIKGNEEKMIAAVETGFTQAMAQLETVDFSKYEDIIFVSKSIGTAVATRVTATKRLNTRNIYYTPLAYTFIENMGKGIAFTGTKDPWVETQTIKDNCARYKIPLTVITEGNHSLETDDVYLNIDIVKTVLIRAEEYALN